MRFGLLQGPQFSPRRMAFLFSLNYQKACLTGVRRDLVTETVVVALGAAGIEYLRVEGDDDAHFFLASS
tara:strand:+ start:47777 stop:47983 length:207 start_codon:yes stop_codon:yes gene_type:complete